MEEYLTQFTLFPFAAPSAASLTSSNNGFPTVKIAARRWKSLGRFRMNRSGISGMSPGISSSNLSVAGMGSGALSCKVPGQIMKNKKGEIL